TRSGKQLHYSRYAGEFLAFSADGKTLATGPIAGQSSAEGDARRIHLWDVSTWKEIAHVVVPTNLRGPVAFAPDGMALAVTHNARVSRVHVWDLAPDRARRP